MPHYTVPTPHRMLETLEEQETRDFWNVLMKLDKLKQTDALHLIRGNLPVSAAEADAGVRPDPPCPAGMVDMALIEDHEFTWCRPDESWQQPELRPDIRDWLDATCPGQYSIAEHLWLGVPYAEPAEPGEDERPRYFALFLRLPEDAAIVFRLRWR